MSFGGRCKTDGKANKSTHLTSRCTLLQLSSPQSSFSNLRNAQVFLFWDTNIKPSLGYTGFLTIWRARDQPPTFVDTDMHLAKKNKLVLGGISLNGGKKGLNM